MTTDLDVANASAQLRSTMAEIPRLEQQEAADINALSLLLGQPPNALRGELAEPRPVPPVPPRVPVGLPSELARRRPDVMQAEAQLHAATATIGVAVAAFYPSVTLSGSIGLQALQPVEFLQPERSAIRRWAGHHHPDLPGRPAQGDTAVAQRRNRRRRR